MPETSPDTALLKIQDFTCFRELKPEERLQLAERFATRVVPKNQILLAPGESPGDLFLVAQGKAVVEAMGTSIDNPVLAELTPGNFFPVEALYQKRPVFSTFRVTEECTLYCLPAARFQEALQEFPGFRRFCEARSNILIDETRKLYTNQLSTRPDYQSLDMPLATIVRGAPLTFPPETPLRQVLREMAAQRAEVAVIVNSELQPLGIFTLSDLLHRVALNAYPTDAPVSGVMTQDLQPLSGKLPGSHAALEMARHGHRQVVVVEEGKVIGLVNERDLFGLQRVGLAQIAVAIQQAENVEALIQCSDDIRRLSHNLLDQGVRSEQLTQIISTLNDQLTEQILRRTALQEPPGDATFCWLALGSEGRHEQTLSSDQDNAIIFRPSEGVSAEEAREPLLRFARQVNTILDQCGFPLCKGGIMAGNPKWCLSLEEWERQFLDWIGSPEPESLLNATIFFDFRPLHGEKSLANQLRARVTRTAKTNQRFLHLMVESALERSPPLGLLRDFVTGADGTIDLKLSGIALFVDAARIFSLAHEIVSSGTRYRLRQASRHKKIPAKEVDAWNDAFDFLQHLRLRMQHDQHLRGKPVTNKVDPNSLNELDRRFLIESLRQAGRLQKRLGIYKITDRGM
ncbi:MAG: CBS domain-containing protein [Magnetococcales bacterium]|nr:CBS domain-containing protein [Magnetococcales bacterium]